MGSIPTVKVNDPGKPGDYLVINQSDFERGGYTLFGEGAAPSSGKPKAPPAPPAGAVLPAGYALVSQPGGRRKVTLNGETLKHAEGPKAGNDVSFANEAEAIAAAIELAAAIAAAE